MNQTLSSTQSLISHIKLETGSNPKYSVIWLHGLGADGNDFAPIVPELSLKQPVCFIFPNAPSIPVTINNGFVMPAWYDILDMNVERKVDVAQLRQSADHVVALIEHEIEQGIPSENIIIAGFSQGGAVALEAALSYSKPLAGLLVMSTYFATQNSIKLSLENKNIPIMINHGTYDPVVPAVLGEKINQVLLEQNYQTQYLTYPMEHSVCPQQIADINQWINNLI